VVDPAVDALVLSVSDNQVLRHGWPVDRCDAVVLAGGGVRGQRASGQDVARLAQLCRAAARLEPRAIFVASAQAVLVDLARTIDWRSARRVELPEPAPAQGGQASNAAAIAAAVSTWMVAQK